MGTVATEATSPGGFGSDLSGMGNFFFNPTGAAARLNSKWFWVAPLILFSIVSIIASYVMMPLVHHVMETTPLPAGVSQEQYSANMGFAEKIEKVTMYFAPVMAAIIFAIQALVLWIVSMATNSGAKFRQLFNLIAGCSLIQVLAALSSVFILKAKGEISSMADLRPALGLDVFLPEGMNKVLVAVIGYFSVFEIWWIVMLVLIYSVAFRVSKGKAIAVVAPVIVLSILFRAIGAAFQR